MVDRHRLSDPRYIGDVQWEVDVFRENVDQAVDTLVINSKTLPPRTRKGKIVWQLPTDPTKPPSFGTEDRKRIFEIFKERKKQRKKEKSLWSKHNSNMSEQNSNVQDGSWSIQQEEDKSSDETNNNTSAEKTQSVEKVVNKGKPQSGTKTRRGKRKTKSPVPVNRDKASTTTNSFTDNGNNQDTLETEGKSEMPKNLHKSFEEKLSVTENSEEQSQPLVEIKLSTSGKESRQDDTQPNQLKHLVPERPYCTFNYDVNEGTSISVSIAKQFIDRYYPSVQIDGGADLAFYYTESAQKSISIGGAHFVVTGHDAIATQLMSFRGAFSTRSIVAQDTAEGGVHLLVTGIYVPVDGIPCPFAHTVILVSHNGQIPRRDTNVTDEYRFKIHNDALALIGDVPVRVPPAPLVPNVSPLVTPQMPPPGFG